MKCSFKCPGCGHVMTCDAANDDEAVNKLNEMGKAHAQQVHADMPAMSDEEMTKMIREKMTKE